MWVFVNCEVSKCQQNYSCYQTFPTNNKQEEKEVSEKTERIDVKISQRERETRQVIYMLILIMLLFFTCWSPILIFNVLGAFDLLGEGNTGTAAHTKHIKTAFSLLSYSNR